MYIHPVVPSKWRMCPLVSTGKQSVACARTMYTAQNDHSCGPIEYNANRKWKSRFTSTRKLENAARSSLRDEWKQYVSKWARLGTCNPSTNNFSLYQIVQAKILISIYLVCFIILLSCMFYHSIYFLIKKCSMHPHYAYKYNRFTEWL